MKTQIELLIYIFLICYKLLYIILFILKLLIILFMISPIRPLGRTSDTGTIPLFGSLSNLGFKTIYSSHGRIPKHVTKKKTSCYYQKNKYKIRVLKI